MTLPKETPTAAAADDGLKFDLLLCRLEGLFKVLTNDHHERSGVMRFSSVAT